MEAVLQAAARFVTSHRAIDQSIDAPYGILAASTHLLVSIDTLSPKATLVAFPWRQPLDLSGTSPRSVLLHTEFETSLLSLALNSRSTYVALCGAVEQIRKTAFSAVAPDVIPETELRAVEVGAAVAREARFSAASRAIVSVQWYPAHDTGLAVLTNDGVVRVYDVATDVERPVVELRADMPIISFAFGPASGLGWTRLSIWATLQSTNALCSFCPVVLPGMRVEKAFLSYLVATCEDACQPAKDSVFSIVEEIQDAPVGEGLVRLRCPERMRAPTVRPFEPDGEEALSGAVTAMVVVPSDVVSAVVVRVTSAGLAAISLFFDTLPPFLSTAALVAAPSFDLKLSPPPTQSIFPLSIAADPNDRTALYCAHAEGAHEVSLAWLTALETHSSSEPPGCVSRPLLRFSPPEPATGLICVYDTAAGVTRVLVAALSGACEALSSGRTSRQIMAPRAAAEAGEADLRIPAVPPRVHLSLPEDPVQRVAEVARFVTETHLRYVGAAAEFANDITIRLDAVQRNATSLRAQEETFLRDLRSVVMHEADVAATIGRLCLNQRNFYERLQLLLDLWGAMRVEISTAEAEFIAEMQTKTQDAKRLSQRADELLRIANNAVEAVERRPQTPMTPLSTEDRRKVEAILRDENEELGVLKTAVENMRFSVASL